MSHEKKNRHSKYAVELRGVVTETSVAFVPKSTWDHLKETDSDAFPEPDKTQTPKTVPRQTLNTDLSQMKPTKRHTSERKKPSTMSDINI
jgi:hypothetical protein